MSMSCPQCGGRVCGSWPHKAGDVGEASCQYGSGVTRKMDDKRYCDWRGQVIRLANGDVAVLQETRTPKHRKNPTESVYVHHASTEEEALAFLRRDRPDAKVVFIERLKPGKWHAQIEPSKHTRAKATRKNPVTATAAQVFEKARQSGYPTVGFTAQQLVDAMWPNGEVRLRGSGAKVVRRGRTHSAMQERKMVGNPHDYRGINKAERNAESDVEEHRDYQYRGHHGRKTTAARKREARQSARRLSKATLAAERETIENPRSSGKKLSDVHYTAKGQPFIVLANGQHRFISKAAAGVTHEDLVDAGLRRNGTSWKKAKGIGGEPPYFHTREYMATPGMTCTDCGVKAKGVRGESMFAPFPSARPNEILWCSKCVTKQIARATGTPYVENAGLRRKNGSQGRPAFYTLVGGDVRPCDLPEELEGVLELDSSAWLELEATLDAARSAYEVVAYPPGARPSPAVIKTAWDKYEAIYNEAWKKYRAAPRKNPNLRRNPGLVWQSSSGALVALGKGNKTRYMIDENYGHKDTGYPYVLHVSPTLGGRDTTYAAKNIDHAKEMAEASEDPSLRKNPNLRRNHHLQPGDAFVTPEGRYGWVTGAPKSGRYPVKWQGGSKGTVKDTGSAAVPI